MKKFFIFIALIIFLSACSPSPEAVAQAIAQTQTAMPTETPSPTATNTYVPVRITPRVATTPAPNYYIETGFCVMGVDNIQGDPDEVPGCGSQEREQIALARNQAVTITFSGNISDRQNYCALFKLDGTFVMADVDTNASGKVVCKP